MSGGRRGGTRRADDALSIGHGTQSRFVLADQSRATNPPCNATLRLLRPALAPTICRIEWPHAQQPAMVQLAVKGCGVFDG